MQECICTRCKNLKSVSFPAVDLDSEEISENLDSNPTEILYECEFGYPDEQCAECEVDECELTCDHFIPETTSTPVKIGHCASCGKELQLISNDDDGDVFCINCFLNR